MSANSMDVGLTPPHLTDVKWRNVDRYYLSPRNNALKCASREYLSQYMRPKSA